MRRHTLDHCPVSPYSEVARIVQEELGQPPEALFAEFEPAPIASASLAQVLGLFRSGGSAEPPNAHAGRASLACIACSAGLR